MRSKKQKKTNASLTSKIHTVAIQFHLDGIFDLKRNITSFLIISLRSCNKSINRAHATGSSIIDSYIDV